VLLHVSGVPLFIRLDQDHRKEAQAEITDQVDALAGQTLGPGPRGVMLRERYDLTISDVVTNA